MSTSTAIKRETTQVYRVYIKATPEVVWNAITNAEWNCRYGYGSRQEYDLRPGGKYRALASDAMKVHGGPDVIVDGEIIEVDPPRKLVQTWRPLWDPEMVAEGFTRLTWEIDGGPGGVTTLTVTHELDRAPKIAAQAAGQIPQAGGGWAMTLSDLKTLLETGSALWS
jgi:uncharacterized protein YndB with AHSA1/START domain